MLIVGYHAHTLHDSHAIYLSKVVVYESAWPLFEAAGETALMRRSNATHYFVSVQPDQQVQ